MITFSISSDESQPERLGRAALSAEVVAVEGMLALPSALFSSREHGPKKKSEKICKLLLLKVGRSPMFFARR